MSQQAAARLLWEHLVSGRLRCVTFRSSGLGLSEPFHAWMLPVITFTHETLADEVARPASALTTQLRRAATYVRFPPCEGPLLPVIPSLLLQIHFPVPLHCPVHEGPNFLKPTH